jgi:uncharacterized protein (TIGR02118 family)
MVRITIIYPAKDSAHFDMEYYLTVHAPLALNRLGNCIAGFTVDVGLSEPLMPAPIFVAAGHYLCATVADFMSAYMPHAAELQADVANYTNIVPIVQVSEVHVVMPVAH